jgi:hypothetical protein
MIFKKEMLVCFFSLVIFSSCRNGNPGISKLWFYTYSSDSSVDKNNLTPANFLELSPGGLFTSDLGKFKSGHWSLKGRQLFLRADDGTVNILFINELKSDEMQIRANQANAAHFDALPVPKMSEDPFSKANNLWRICAKSKETDNQIRTRLRNHCNYWVNYFIWALDNELTTVDVRSTPTPIKIYGNGFSIKKFKDLPESWKEYFYDSADCARGNAMLEDLVRAHTIAWAHTDNKYKMFISAFQQMEKFLR